MTPGEACRLLHAYDGELPQLVYDGVGLVESGEPMDERLRRKVFAYLLGMCARGELPASLRPAIGALSKEMWARYKRLTPRQREHVHRKEMREAVAAWRRLTRSPALQHGRPTGRTRPRSRRRSTSRSTRAGPDGSSA